MRMRKGKLGMKKLGKKVKALIVDGSVRCASQLCDSNCPNKTLCVDAILVTKEEVKQDY